jgi:SAM-dependent methyltransferase
MTHMNRMSWDDRGDELAAASIADGDPTGWFERLYAEGAAGDITMPWDRAAASPLLVEWSRTHKHSGSRAIVVGCGLGADAEHVASLGYETVAFDVSETAVRLARERHPGSPVQFHVADLLDLPPEWMHAFDLVVEIITVQALPEPPRHSAIVNVGRLVAPGGTLLAIAAHPDDGPRSPARPGRSPAPRSTSSRPIIYQLYSWKPGQAAGSPNSRARPPDGPHQWSTDPTKLWSARRRSPGLGPYQRWGSEPGDNSHQALAGAAPVAGGV